MTREQKLDDLLDATGHDPAGGESTIIEVLEGYANGGFDSSFIVTDDSELECVECGNVTAAARFSMSSLRRLEGASDPADMVAVVAITCPVCGSRGTVILGFGPSATHQDSGVLTGLHDDRDDSTAPGNSAPGETTGDHALVEAGRPQPPCRRARQPFIRVALSTGGGDAPGINAVIRAATLGATRRGWEVVGIRDGFNGLMFPEQYPQGNGMVRFDASSVRGIGYLGGTVLGSTNRGNPCHFPVEQPDGTIVYEDRTEHLVSLFHEAGIDALITIGGDGSLAIGDRLCRAGLRVIGVPKTIDNDLDKTEVTFGFDTAVFIATESIDRLFTTATSHSRVFVVEVMGRYAGWIALNAGVAAGAHAILIPEIPFRLEPVAEMINRRQARGAGFAIVVVAEGAMPQGGGRSVLGQARDQAERLGGIGEQVARQLTQLTGKEARTAVLGHLLRGGVPTAQDRLLGTRFGAAAARALELGLNGVMVAVHELSMEYVPLADAIGRMRSVPLDCDTMIAARET